MWRCWRSPQEGLEEQVVQYFRMGHLEVIASTLVARFGVSQQGAKATLDKMVENGLLECIKLGRKGRKGDAIYVPSGKIAGKYIVGKQSQLRYSTRL